MDRNGAIASLENTNGNQYQDVSRHLAELFAGTDLNRLEGEERSALTQGIALRVMDIHSEVMRNAKGKTPRQMAEETYNKLLGEIGVGK